MKKEDLYYTAGLMDGEGTITLTVINKGKYRAPSVSVTSTTPELLTYLKENFGGCVCKQKTYKEHHKPSNEWKVRYDAAYRFIELITPYLKEPEKKRRGELILRDYKKLTPRNGKYTAKMVIMKEKFEKEFFKYNPLLC